MFFLAATLVGRIGGDSVYRMVAAKNIFLPLKSTNYHLDICLVLGLWLLGLGQ